MTKQQEIRGGIAHRIDYNCEGCTFPDTISCIHPCKQQYQIADELSQYLHSQGVVLKVEGELPTIFDSNEDVISAYEYKQKLAGSTLTASLIEE